MVGICLLTLAQAHRSQVASQAASQVASRHAQHSAPRSPSRVCLRTVEPDPMDSPSAVEPSEPSDKLSGVLVEPPGKS